jgi:hypothetical protein
MKFFKKFQEKMSKTYNDYLLSLNSEQAGIATLNVRERTFEVKEIENYNFNYNVKNVVCLIDNSGSTSNAFSGRSSSRRGYPVISETPIESDPDATKHISLAEYESLAICLEFISKIDINSFPINLIILGFSFDVQLPNNGQTIIEIHHPSEIMNIARNIHHYMPYPQFTGTLLCPPLKCAFTTLKERNLIDNTLLFVITDGQTEDKEETSLELQNFNRLIIESNKRFDIITIGAGNLTSSISNDLNRNSRFASVPPAASAAVEVVEQKQYESPSRSLRNYNTRRIDFTSSHSSSYSECNINYLIDITGFKSPNGNSVYGGAYRDYSDLIKLLEKFFSGENDGSFTLFNESDFPGQFYLSHSYHYEAFSRFLISEEVIFEFNKNGYIFSLFRENGKIYYRNEYGIKRGYLFLPKSTTENFLSIGDRIVLSSSDPEYEALIRSYKTYILFFNLGRDDEDGEDIYSLGYEYQYSYFKDKEDFPVSEEYMYDNNMLGGNNVHVRVYKVDKFTYYVTNIADGVNKFLYIAKEDIKELIKVYDENGRINYKIKFN